MSVPRAAVARHLGSGIIATLPATLSADLAATRSAAFSAAYSAAFSAARLAAFFVPLAIALFATSPTRAQHDGAGASNTTPPPPAGSGRIVVTLTSEEANANLAALPIALYSLSSDGRPGFTNGTTDATGRAVFENVSSDPGIVYLLGARYHEVPFGARAAFAEGKQEAAVSIAVSSPSEDATPARVEELRIRIDWMGGRVLVREILRVANAGQQVILLGDGRGDGRAPARSIVTRRLAPDASDFEAGASSLGDVLVRDGDRVRYAGPLYPGDQTVEYQYSLPSPKPGERLRLPVELDRAASRLVAIAGTDGLTIEAPGLVASSPVDSDTGTPLAAWARAKLGAGEATALEVAFPETRSGEGLVSIPRADLWLDLDDTRLTATADLTVAVAPGAPVAGSAEAPLLAVKLPPGATLTGVAPETERLGLVPREHGGFDLVGPLGPGETHVGYAYRLASGPDGVDLALEFSRAVATLNVLIADSGLAATSSRLHRLRPFRDRTRTYLHREAFNVAPDEKVDLALEPLSANAIPRSAGVALALASIAGTGAFLFAPLMRRTAARAPEDPAAHARAAIRAEREATYAAIRDLDHDFETGKLEPDDHAAQRAALRARAIELLAAERDPSGASSAAPAVSTSSASAAASASAGSAAAAVASAGSASSAVTESQRVHGFGFCPSCGRAREVGWRFCAGCGSALSGPPEPGA